MLSSFFMAHNFWVMAIPSAVSFPLFIILAKNANQQEAFHAFKWPVFILTAFVILFVVLVVQVGDLLRRRTAAVERDGL